MKQFTLLFLATLAVSGCVRRYPPDDSQYNCRRASEAKLREERARRPLPQPRTPGASIQIVRLTDDGELHNRCEWSDALRALRRDSTHRAGTITVMYVHGWKHNGDPEDTDLLQFAQLVDSLRVREVRTKQAGVAGPADRRVVGLYLAWAGKRTSVPVLKELTFWGRKKAADRIAQSAIVTKLVGAVDNIRRQRGNPDDRVIYAGHSFGARLLFNAVAQLSIHRSQLAYPDTSERSFSAFGAAGDLVLLVNPAFEAQLFTALDGLNRFEYRFNPEQRPLIVSISADNDWATGKAFPIGQFLGRTWNVRRRTTLGNYGPYQTHRLFPSPATRDTSQEGGGAWFDRYCATADAPSSSKVCLQHTSPTPAGRQLVSGNPFIVARAEKSIVDGHGGIWSRQFVGFLADFIATAMRKPVPPEERRGS